jgi:hypothetical protein
MRGPRWRLGEPAKPVGWKRKTPATTSVQVSYLPPMCLCGSEDRTARGLVRAISRIASPPVPMSRPIGTSLLTDPPNGDLEDP